MIFLLSFSYFDAMLYIFELFIFELIIYLSVSLSSGYCNLYPAMLYFCIIKSYQKAGYYIMRLKDKNHFSSLMGIAVSAVCLICFGADSFMIPTMAAIVIILAISRNKL